MSRQYIHNTLPISPFPLPPILSFHPILTLPPDSHPHSLPRPTRTLHCGPYRPGTPVRTTTTQNRIRRLADQQRLGEVTTGSLGVAPTASPLLRRLGFGQADQAASRRETPPRIDVRPR